MLVLTRKCDEEIVIDDRIIVKVMQCGSGRVKLGIIAPTSISVRRSEIESLTDVLAESVQSTSRGRAPVRS